MTWRLLRFGTNHFLWWVRFCNPTCIIVISKELPRLPSTLQSHTGTSGWSATPSYMASYRLPTLAVWSENSSILSVHHFTRWGAMKRRGALCLDNLWSGFIGVSDSPHVQEGWDGGYFGDELAMGDSAACASKLGRLLEVRRRCGRRRWDWFTGRNSTEMGKI